MCRIAGACGVDNASNIVRRMLQQLQHGGQEGAGIASEQDGKMFVHRGFGLVDEVFRDTNFGRDLPGRSAIGHVRYATTGESRRTDNLHPFLGETLGGPIALVHNGNLTNFQALRTQILKGGHVLRTDSDTELIMALLGNGPSLTLAERLMRMYGQAEGAATLLALAPGIICAGSDAHQWRPLVWAPYQNGFLFASESRALGLFGIKAWETLRPGTVIEMTQNGIKTHAHAAGGPCRHCVFEHVYFAMPDSRVFNEHVGTARLRMGAALARRMPPNLDVVIAVPQSGLVATQEVSNESGIRIGIGLVRNPYMGRTFISPTQEARELGVRVKLSVDDTVVAGKRVGVVDDSIVRGTTSRQIVSLIREAGALEVHLLISSPPVVHPCYWGIDTPHRKHLIAARVAPEKLAAELGADSVTFLTEGELLDAVGDPQGERHCTYCFTGKKPVPTHYLPGEENE